MNELIPGFKCPETIEERRAGMKAFRAKLLGAHQRMLAGGDENTKRKGKVGEAARAYHAACIATIQSEQAKRGEVAA